MQGVLFAVFDFVAKNRWVQWLLLVIVTLVTLGFYLAWRDGNVRRRERERAEAETITVVREIEKESAHAADEAVAARDAAPVYPDAASVPPQVADRIFRD